MASVDSTSDGRIANNTMRHKYRVLSDDEKASMSAIKDEGLKFHDLIVGLGNSRELSLDKTKIEEAVMWAVKHTAIEVIEPIGEKVVITLKSGRALEMADSQTRIRDAMNRKPADG